MKPSLTPLYCINNVGKVVNDSIVRYKLPKRAVKFNGTIHAIDQQSCTMIDVATYLCTAALHLVSAPCLTNMTDCNYEAKTYTAPETHLGNYGHLVATKESCHLRTRYDKTELKPDGGFLYVPYSSYGYLSCGDELIPMENRTFEYTYHYFTDSAPTFNHQLIKYTVKEWSDESKLQDLQARSEQRQLDKIKLFATNYLHYILFALVIAGLISIVLSIFAYCRVCIYCSTCGNCRFSKGGGTKSESATQYDKKSSNVNVKKNKIRIKKDKRKQ